ncbi:MAG: PorT family protein [Bacteroidales bacterium]|nr:PorT family protein [Bacteroidales bacterium]
MKHVLTLALAMIMALPGVFAQGGVKTINLPNYDNRPIHFGFSLGVNQMGFDIQRADNFMTRAEIYGVDFKKHIGLHLGPLADLRLGRYFDARAQFILSFNQRDLNYYCLELDNAEEQDIAKGTLHERNMTINSTMLEVPLMIKARGERKNNVAPYIVAGGAFRYDLKAGKTGDDEDCIKLKKIDPCLVAGLGLDFYLPYFKLSTELKYNLGLLNVLDPADTPYSNSIKSIKSNGFTLTFHFE